MSKPHKKLVAWSKSMDLVERIYEVTRTFPREEIYGLTSQLRRAAVSVPSNIAEGAAGRSFKRVKRWLMSVSRSRTDCVSRLNATAFE